MAATGMAIGKEVAGRGLAVLVLALALVITADLIAQEGTETLQPGDTATAAMMSAESEGRRNTLLAPDDMKVPGQGRDRTRDLLGQNENVSGIGNTEEESMRRGDMRKKRRSRRNISCFASRGSNPKRRGR